MVSVNILAIRGANCAKANDAEEIRSACIELAEKLLSENQLNTEDIITVFITMTADLTKLNASAAIRQGMGWDDVPFFTSQEPEIEGMLPRCIRVLLQINSNKNRNEIHHVYLNEAAKLRPDLKQSQ